LAAFLSPACGAPPKVGDATENDVRTAATGQGGIVMNQQRPINQRFRTLDDYLAHLEARNAPIDKPWYREIRPGVYELQTGNLRILPTGEEGGDAAKRIFTREELERKFGFTN
jgi:hypothetical protein